MGIFPGSAGGAFPGFGMNPDQAMFIMIMSLIRTHSGDPPTTPAMVQQAEAVFLGQIEPINAMIAAAPPLAQQQLVVATQMAQMAGMSQLIRLQAMIQVAISLPRERIPILLPEVEHQQTAG